MSVLPVEEQPSGAVPADTGNGSRGPRSRPGGAAARPAVHPLFPARKWLQPDGDCIFPGGGRTFPGQAAPADGRTSRGQAAPGHVRNGRAGGPGAQRAARPPAEAGRTADARRTIRSSADVRRTSLPSAAARRPVQPLTSVPVLSGPVLSGPVVPAARRATGAAASHRLRLTRRGRIVLAVAAVLVVCGLFVAGASAAQASAAQASGPASAHGGPGAAERVVVQPGDTLWSIAQSAAPNADARTIVQEILQANRLTTANITAGQRLWVPRG
jgi:LysM repeat protein